ncbi:hypothetical protein RUM8411_00737 [Ruegeria meonggei]|uniref:Uncharacterized protein n=1 Tax=Ruegeria meonggei TaxID=1446476 RepID=A0A1X6YII8_9RHOB|nr:hypothetical protein RUM8411_00737 [Ruegeria meonggei]
MRSWRSFDPRHGTPTENPAVGRVFVFLPVSSWPVRQNPIGLKLPAIDPEQPFQLAKRMSV